MPATWSTLVYTIMHYTRKHDLRPCGWLLVDNHLHCVCWWMTLWLLLDSLLTGLVADGPWPAHCQGALRVTMPTTTLYVKA